MSSFRSRSIASRITHATDTRFFRAISLSSRCCSAVRLTDRRCADLSSLAVAMLGMAAICYISMHHDTPERCWGQDSHSKLLLDRRGERGDEQEQEGLGCGLQIRVRISSPITPSPFLKSNSRPRRSRRSIPAFNLVDGENDRTRPACSMIVCWPTPQP